MPEETTSTATPEEPTTDPGTVRGAVNVSKTVNAAPQPPDGVSFFSGKAYGIVRDLMALLVIPALGWIVKLEVGNKGRDMEIAQLHKDDSLLQKNLEQEAARLKDEIDEAKDIRRTVDDNAKQLIRLEGKIDASRERLNEIRNLLTVDSRR